MQTINYRKILFFFKLEEPNSYDKTGEQAGAAPGFSAYISISLQQIDDGSQYFIYLD